MKNIFASKTVWVNSLTLAAAALTYVVNHDLFVHNPDLSAALVAVLALVNIGLRLVTNTGVSVSKTEEPAE
jgi:hypothetical protein